MYEYAPNLIAIKNDLFRELHDVSRDNYILNVIQFNYLRFYQSERQSDKSIVCQIVMLFCSFTIACKSLYL